MNQYSNNFINIQPDTRIYRVFSFHRFLQTIESQKNVLVRPKKWDDPFENLWEKIKAKDKDGKIITFGQIGKLFYGQCWTLREESDALWRIYAPNKDGIRVSTTAEKIFKYLYDETNPFASLCCHIGRVEYFTETELKTKLNEPGFVRCHLDSEGLKLAQLLLLKRKEFEHEEEVRLIFRATSDLPQDNVKNKWVAGSDIFSFLIDPNEVFDDIAFDPRMDDDLFKSMSQSLRTMGFSNPITKSTLYHPPEFELSF